MTFIVQARITRTKRCPEGFYLLANGQRLHFKRHRDAVAALESLLEMQRFQVVTVRDYARSKQCKSKPPA